MDSSAYRKAVRRSEALEGLLSSHRLASSTSLLPRVAAVLRKSQLQAQLKAVRREVKAAGSTVLRDELKARMRVLKRLG